ncbi:MAG: hypothetical protein EZS26_000912 [Candidatus Ordinivivax streblomastigis]|uniref:IPT/TIG domain-containing protein n=1 Tax=Candidatus Ordinivivax streblomastigis TaxID=2540710 RepID=A0A5M8P3G0_9BACT|nr:MAG: hypothetical protein EZS26_000912 [Candidatus Ordinivivax streblomastigis]
MEKKEKTKVGQAVFILSCLILSVFFTGCEDNTVETKRVLHNPDLPVTITTFSPDSGRVATQMLIDGENFGGYKDGISVRINGKEAAVISVNPEGTLIYCIVPSLRDEETREDGDQIDATVQVYVGEVASNKLDKQLAYTFSQNVSTFLGFTDQDGKTAVIDGKFDEAQFQNPFWLAFDTDLYGPVDAQGRHKKNVYLIEENIGLRYIDMYEKTVSTVFRTGNGVDRPRTIAFTKNTNQLENYRDTMIIANDGGDWGSNGTIIIPRDTVTRRFLGPWQSVMHHKQCNGGAIHPISGDYWFNSYEKSQVYKVFNRAVQPWLYGGPSASDLNADAQDGTHFFFLVQDNNWEFNIQIAPDGKIAYIVSKNQHYIAKMEYDFIKAAFGTPYPFVGAKQKSGFKDGLGLETLFNQPQQGAFDKDNNFYVCDGENNCIRKVTPAGQVSVFAGRQDMRGYSDGALRDAQFDRPFGIIYDDEIQTFYIADRSNSRIRTIKVE